MRFLLLAMLLAAACKHATSSSSETHSETSTTTESTSSETGNTTTVTTTTEAPGKTTTTVEDYGPPEEVMPSVPDERGGSLQSDGGVPATPGAVSRPSHGPLVRRTVTVTEHGQETTQTRQEATSQGTAASETRAQAQSHATVKTKDKGGPAASCAFGAWGIGLLAAVIGMFLLVAFLKARKVIP